MSTAPEHLEASERELWDAITREYELDDPAALALLTAALEARQRARQCRETIDAEGLLVDGKPHPLLVAERDARKAFAAILRQLDLDPGVAEARPVGRPPHPIGAPLHALRKR